MAVNAAAAHAAAIAVLFAIPVSYHRLYVAASLQVTTISTNALRSFAFFVKRLRASPLGCSSLAGPNRHKDTAWVTVTTANQPTQNKQNQTNKHKTKSAM
eukprot:GHVQ01033095.1.p1 GENE.GHVQ01033095.1~~GHVQ01033095.1.p1  ORF type:complete len:100 (-),score=15.93 GHVQ01033095.1:11-310(-)